MEKIEVNKAVWEGITHYLRSLHQQAAVDDVKMKFDNYKPLAELLDLWGIEPYPPRPSRS